MKDERKIDNYMIISRTVHRLTYHWRRLVNIYHQKNGLDQETIMNGRILGVLHFAQNDIYQKDLEKSVGLTKSAISNILSDMERKGYIERCQVEGDARLRKIVLTPYGEETHKKLASAIKKVDSRSIMGLSLEEQAELIRMLGIIEKNMKEMEAEVK